MKIALITRCKDEPFVHEFVAYYVNEGVDNIFIYDDQSNMGTYDKIDTKYKDKVTIINSKNHISNKAVLNNMLNALYKRVKSFDWVINVDMDEFVTANDDKTIRTHLETTYKDVDRIKIPWVMMTRNGRIKNPNSLLRDITHRWNHDLTHMSDNLPDYKFRCYRNLIPCKSIFKPSKFRKCGIHNPYQPYDITTVKNVDSVYNGFFDMKPKKSIHYEYFNEECIKNATLLCYHYRIYSEECVLNKLNGCVYNFDAVKMLDYDYPEVVDFKMRDKANSYSI
jgi:hypothetical protein